jgi:penicillin-insensitive murein endopeptidase
MGKIFLFFRTLTLITVLAIGGVIEPLLAQSHEDGPRARPESISVDLPAKFLFGAAQRGSKQRAQSHGSYAKGCLAGAKALPETGPTWQAMRLSRNRNWGQPVLIDYVQDLSRKVARETSWKGIYIGDISQPRGGPMLSGHASHQIGLDADIWLLPARDLNLDQAVREEISSVSTRRSKGAFTNNKWTAEHEAILKLAASDPRVARIFIFPGAKVAMCKSAKGSRDWLRKIRPWYGHHYHFHVRMKCPKAQKGCKNQAPPPLGDGCDEAQGWVDRILNPPPPNPNPKPRKPRPEIKLSALPKQCSTILTSP